MLPWYYIPGRVGCPASGNLYRSAARCARIRHRCKLPHFSAGCPADCPRPCPACRRPRAPADRGSGAGADRLFIIATGSTLYDGIRHILFTLPPLALIAAWAMLKLAPMIRRFPIPLAALAAAQVVSAVFVLVEAAPAGICRDQRLCRLDAGSYGQFELDYWTRGGYSRAAPPRNAYRARRRARPDRPPRLFICIPWRENMVTPMFRRAWRIAAQSADGRFHHRNGTLSLRQRCRRHS